MSIPPSIPVPGRDPVPGTGEPPPVPIDEPEPDRLPDEEPNPNPDENDEPEKRAVPRLAPLALRAASAIGNPLMPDKAVR
ncbi:hypothetical protein LXM94_03675 [Rhizobium sp. TRM95111]|uniref:hypothetical protein n=1 Tax=Rhizobium alarense TaxID=2846851 RepID=UPI001F2FFDDC|nr:hypothetical protein [Rhizobium alarense]MCF3639061.1 hypothetical protein [Rhizobium alarense]